MNFPQFFIDRPIFAARALDDHLHQRRAVAAGSCRSASTPRSCRRRSSCAPTYPGANPQVIAETVAAPLEQAINGVEDMLYMSSQSTADGADDADRHVQARHRPRPARRCRCRTACSRRCRSCRRKCAARRHDRARARPTSRWSCTCSRPTGATTCCTCRNYATLQVRDELARLAGVGQVQVFGAGDYAMRVWLDPEKVAARNLTAGDVVQAIREQNVQVAAGADRRAALASRGAVPAR